MSKFRLRPGEHLGLDILQSELSRLLDRLYHCGVSTPPLDGQDWAPALELREETDRYVVLAELPGVARDRIELDADAGSLTLTGDKPCPPLPAVDTSRQPEPRVVHTECRYGRFTRKLTLPGQIQPEGVSASFKNGVLEVILPKQAEARSNVVRIGVQ